MAIYGPEIGGSSAELEPVSKTKSSAADEDKINLKQL